jgi:hypothetical protein
MLVFVELGTRGVIREDNTKLVCCTHIRMLTLLLKQAYRWT